MCRVVWLLMASRGTSRGERVKVPVDAVLILVLLVRSYFSQRRKIVVSTV